MQETLSINNPTVSIIVPCYNSSKKMSSCLNSLIEQTYKNIEVIFVDDCSDADTKNTLADFATNSGVKTVIIENASNLGPSLSRQKGVKESNGTFLTFIDSDDYVDKTFIAEMLQSILLNKSDISFCDYYFVSKSTKLYKKRRFDSLLLTKTSDKITVGVDSLWGILFNKKLFQNIEFPDIRNGEDMAVVPQLFLKANTISHVDRCLYFYIYYPNSLSNDVDFEAIAYLKESLLCLEKTLRKSYPKEVEFLAVRNYLYSSILILAKNKSTKSKLCSFSNDFQAKYPCWNKNSYIKSLPNHKRLVLFLFKHHLFFCLKVICFLRGLFLTN